MPKATITLSETDMMQVMNRDRRIPGKVESIVHDEDSFSEFFWVLIDFDPVVDRDTAIFFRLFMDWRFGSDHDISIVNDVEDYAVLENLLAAASHQNPFSFNWVGDE